MRSKNHVTPATAGTAGTESGRADGRHRGKRAKREDVRHLRDNKRTMVSVGLRITPVSGDSHVSDQHFTFHRVSNQISECSWHGMQDSGHVEFELSSICGQGSREDDGSRSGWLRMMHPKEFQVRLRLARDRMCNGAL